MESDPTELVDRVLEALSSEDTGARVELWSLLLDGLPAQPEPFLQALEGLADEVARRLDRDPTERARDVLERLSWECRTAWTPDPSDPRIRSKATMTERGGVKTHPVDLKLGPRVLRSLLRQRSSEDRAALLASLGTWELLTDLEIALCDVDLTAEDFVALLSVAEPLTRGDMARGHVLEPIYDTLQRAPGAGRSIVDAWFAREAWARRLEPPALQIVIEATLAGLEEGSSWRREVVTRLAETSRRELLEIATHVLGFGAGKGGAPEVRHRDLIEFVTRFERELLVAAVEALCREAARSPKVCWETFGSIREEADDAYLGSEEGLRFVLTTARLLWASARDLASDPGRASELAERVAEHRDVLARVPAGRTRDLDAALDDWIPIDPSATVETLIAWMHFPPNMEAIREAAMERHFPLTWKRLGDVHRARLFRDLAVRRGVRDRRLVVPLLQGGTLFTIDGPDSPAIDLETLGELTTTEARALAHVLVMTPANQGFRIKTLFLLALAHPNLVDHIAEILREDGYAEYPGEVRRHLVLWEKDQVAETTREAGERLRGFLDHQTELAAKAHEVPDVRAIRPALREFETTFQASLQEHRDAAFQQSLVGQLGIRVVPLARGRRWTTWEPGATPRDLQEVTHEMEIAGRSLVDPVDALVQAAKHRSKVLEILEEPEPEEGEAE